MKLKAFEGQTFGKWILAGEHAVLRGAPALAFPLLSKSLRLTYHPSGQPLHVEFSGENGAELQLLFWGVLERALEELSIHLKDCGGIFKIHSDLPVGAGLGASAALCSGIGLWCEAQGLVEKNDVYEFSRRLENLFHGESSGVDIAVSLGGKGIRFVRGERERETLVQNWVPKLYLSYSGQRGITSECVNKVKAMIAANPPLGARLDQQMHDSVDLCQTALASAEREGLVQLKTAILLARDCFEHWGLINSEFKKHLQDLEQAGAWVVKPTGSGGGGYALSLWKEEPPEALGLIHT
jgi:mevalonate kinase